MIIAGIVLAILHVILFFLILNFSTDAKSFLLVVNAIGFLIASICTFINWFWGY